MTIPADEHERTMAFAEIALGQIRALRQPASPRHFEIWYTYATGYNPSLNQMINEMLARNGTLGEADIEQIYETYHFAKPLHRPHRPRRLAGHGRDRAGHGDDRRRRRQRVELHRKSRQRDAEARRRRRRRRPCARSSRAWCRPPRRCSRTTRRWKRACRPPSRRSTSSRRISRPSAPKA